MTEHTQPHALPQNDGESRPQMRKHVEDFVNGLHPGEQEEIACVLAPGESVRWATRPRLSFWEWDSAYRRLSALMASAFLAWLMLKSMADASESNCLSSPLIPMGFLLPFWCILLWYMSAPWRRLHRLRRTLYIITDRRALLSEPAFRGWKVQGWALRDNMVVHREAEEDGRGSLVFSQEKMRPLFGRSYLQERGFLCLNDLPRAEQELRAATAVRLHASGEIKCLKPHPSVV